MNQLNPEQTIFVAGHRGMVGAAIVRRLQALGYTQPMLSHINVGTGVDVSIRELAETVARVAGFKGKLTFDASKPDGTPRKLLDVTRLAALGWRASIALEDGLRDAYAWYVANQGSARLG